MKTRTRSGDDSGACGTKGNKQVAALPKRACASCVSYGCLDQLERELTWPN